jgi:hypothetical protein
MQPIIDLTLLNDLIKAFNKEVEISNSSSPTKLSGKAKVDTAYITQLAKTLGLASAISLEATALVGDVSKLIKHNSAPTEDVADTLASLFGSNPLAKKMD